jgi:hypothetical protein
MTHFVSEIFQTDMIYQIIINDPQCCANQTSISAMSS